MTRAARKPKPKYRVLRPHEFWRVWVQSPAGMGAGLHFAAGDGRGPDQFAAAYARYRVRLALARERGKPSKGRK